MRWEWRVVAGKEMGEQAQGPQPQRESGVEATLGVVKGLILRRGRKGREQDSTVPASWEGPPRASWWWWWVSLPPAFLSLRREGLLRFGTLASGAG